MNCPASSATSSQVFGVTRQRTQWFKEAGWGVFFHYLSHIVGVEDDDDPSRWNEVVNSFDTDGLADQLEEIGARYLFITMGQLSGFFCTPNQTYDEIVGRRPSKCSERDLIADLYQALEPRGNRLLTYMGVHPPSRDEQVIEAFEWQDGPHRNYQRPDSGVDEEGHPWGSLNPRLAEFQ